MALFRATKSHDSFDFLALPLRNRALVLESPRLEYVLRRKNLIAVGNNAAL